MRTRRQLDVIAAVTAHKQAGQQSHKNVYTRTHRRKQTSPSPNTHFHTHTHPTNTDTNNLSVYVLSCTDKHPPTQEAEEECPRCKLACVCANATCQKKSTSWMINERVCQPPLPPSVPSTPSPPLHPSLLSVLGQQIANIYLAVYPGSMQSWMSATQEFFCSESMVSRMYSPPFSTCGSSQTL